MSGSRTINKPEPTSACDIFRELLKKRGTPDFRLQLTSYENTFTEATYELLRTEKACKLDMVESPFSTEKNRLFTTKEEYAKYLEKAQHPASENSTPGFGNNA